MICKNCSVALTYHKQRNRMICHYCGYSTKPIHICPECGSLDVGYSGFGTELVEDTVKSLFPFARVGRLDADVTKKRNYLKDTLDQFYAGEIDILLGTQMVAKGLNFPNVELVGVVLADSGLHLPDFRAQERTFSLLLQVAGRAGRFSDIGHVIIQTYHPENVAIRFAAVGNVEAFYEQELKERSMLRFPPETRMCRLVFRARSANKAEHAAKRAADMLDEVVTSGGFSSVSILGPSEPPIARIAHNYRWHILINGRSFKDVHQTVYQFLQRYVTASSVYMEIDLDPVNLL